SLHRQRFAHHFIVQSHTLEHITLPSQPLSSRVDSQAYQGNHDPAGGGEALSDTGWHWLAPDLHPGAARICAGFRQKGRARRFYPRMIAARPARQCRRMSPDAAPPEKTQ
ncbi:MAG: hypothetical protein Q8P60_02415, partial [Pseudorhodobacter sp.]|nr:hypothetical protein [Pseudorhodobacter sp.]